MDCKKCKRPIPRSAEKCPYCGSVTQYGLQKKGERLREKLSPKNIWKEITKK